MSGKLLHLIATILCAATLLVGCGTGELHPQLNAARQLVETDPDSCLTILSTIDTTKLRSDRDRAYSRLLQLRATDKTHRPLSHLLPQADYAVEYFDNHDADSLRMLAHYCRGRVLFANEQYTRTIVDLAEAMDIATARSDWFWMGMCARSISDVFNETYNSSEELHWSKKALEYFGKSGKTDYRNYALLDLALAYNQDCKFDSATMVLRSVADTARAYSDDYLLLESVKVAGLSAFGQEEYSVADSALSTYCASPYATAHDSAYWAMALAANSSFAQLKQLFNELNDSSYIQVLYAKVDYLTHSGDFKSAITVRQQIDSLINTTLQEKVNTQITGTVMTAFDNYKKEHLADSRNARLKLWVVSGFLLLIITLLLTYIYIFIRKKEYDIQSKVLLAREFIDEPLITSGDVDIIDPDTSIKFLDLISERYDIISSMCQAKFDSPTEDISRKRISEEIDKTIELLKDDSHTFNILTETIDNNCDNLCSQIKDNLPDIKERDYRLIIYSIIGFSNSAIALLLDFKTAADVSKRRHKVMSKFTSMPEDLRNKIDSRMRRKNRKKG